MAHYSENDILQICWQQQLGTGLLSQHGRRGNVLHTVSCIIW